MTRCNIERERQLAHSERSGLICSINERSILSGKYIFARNCFESGTMSHTEWDIYNEWTDYVFEHSPELKLDGIIYLRADPNVCASRMKSRGRLDESGVTLEYLLAKGSQIKRPIFVLFSRPFCVPTSIFEPN